MLFPTAAIKPLLKKKKFSEIIKAEKALQPGPNNFLTLNCYDVFLPFDGLLMLNAVNSDIFF